MPTHDLQGARSLLAPSAGALLVILASVAASGCVSAPTVREPATAHELAAAVADRYGLAAFDSIEELHFTFNADIGEKQVQRSWTWWPHAGEVQYRGTDQESAPTTVRYRQSEPVEWVDAMFINDSYWLLFPLHLVWDEGTLAMERGATMPISGAPATRLTITYGPTGGYTPGDAYDLFIAEGYRVAEWVFRKGARAEPSRTTTWEDEVELRGLRVARDHRGEGFRLYFTELAAR